MDTRVFCVYNRARRVFLSSKVTVADGASQPLKVLKVLVSGLALDSESGLWLMPISSMPKVPRLFPFDLVYLDTEHRVLETIEMLPGVDFPAYRREVASAIVLPLNTLRSTQTRRGDQLTVCLLEEAGELLGSADQDRMPEPSERELASHAPKEPAADTLAVSAERDSPGSEALNSRVALADVVDSNHQALAAQPEHEPVAETRAPDEVPIARAKPQPISISEVVIERPQVRPVQSSTEHFGVEELFGNWIDSPLEPPSWIAQKARAGSATSEVAAKKPQIPPERSQPEVRKSANAGPEPAKPSEDLAEKTEQVRSGELPVRAPGVVSRATQATTFTAGSYGMWQVSMPTAVTAPIPAKRVAEGEGAGPVSQGKEPGPAQGPLVKRESTGVPRSESRREEKSLTKFASENGIVLEPEKPVGNPARKRTEDPPKSEKSPAGDRLEHRDAPVRSDIGDWRTHRIVEATGKEIPVEFARAVQDKLEKLQSRVNPAAPATPPDVSAVPEVEPGLKTKPVQGQKLGAAVEKKSSSTKPSAQAKTPNPAKERAPAEKSPGAASPQEQALATVPLPSFLTPKRNEKEKLKSSSGKAGSNGNKEKPEDSLGAKFKRWLHPTSSTKSDRRRAYRRYVPGMVAHYFTGGAPKPHEVADISMTGFYVLTQDRWMPGTMIQMTLQKPCAKGERKQSITVLARVVRRGSDGVAGEFVMSEGLDPHSRDLLPAQATDRFTLARFI